MNALAYRPLYAGVFALQVVTVAAIAFSAVPSPWTIPFAAAWIVVLGISLVLGYRTRSPRGASGRWLVPLVTGAAVLLPWLLIFGARLAYVALALALLAGRNAILATRRGLYFDLALVAGAFYFTISAHNLAGLGGFGAAFLVTLLFVLMADYSDRRLAYVRADDAEARAALTPSLRNAALATLLVLAFAALIYALLPQPGPREVGVYDPEARERAPFPGKRPQGAAEAKGESSGGKASGKDGEGRDTVQPPDSEPSAGAPSEATGQNPKPGDGALARIDITVGGGSLPRPEPGQGSGRRGSDGAEQPGQGSGKAPAPAASGAGGGEAGERQPPGQGPQGRGSDVPSAQGSRPQGQVEAPSDSKGQSQRETTPAPSKLKTDSSRGDSDHRSGPQGSGKPSAGDERQSAKQKEREVSKEPPPLILLYLDAPHAVYVRTHSYVRPSAGDWRESEEPPTRLSGPGRFVIAEIDDRDAFVQRYRSNARLGSRIPAAHRAVRLGFPASTLTFTPDLVLRAPAGLEPGTRYSVVSSVQYAGGRASGGFELDTPSSLYRALPQRMSPRVIELAESLTRGKSNPRERAEALEGYLRSNFRRGGFNAGEQDPTEAFLFVQRQGGSEQFASALGLMLRASGIHSRIAGGYRARRLNPLHGDFELWAADHHYWVEAYVDDRWTTYEPSPWAPPPDPHGPTTSWEAAEEYVRLATRDDSGAEVLPPDRPSDAYLRLVLAWGWSATYGPWILLALALAAFVAWRQRRWLSPWLDRIDLLRLPRGDPRARVLAVYDVTERVFARRELAREQTENHVEFVRRVAAARPHVAVPLRFIAEAFSTARYAAVPPERASSELAVGHCRTIVDLIDELPERRRKKKR